VERKENEENKES